MDLQTIQTILAITAYALAILGIPFGLYKIYNRDQQKDGQEISGIASELKLLRTEMGLKLQANTDALNLIKQNDLHTITEKQRDQDSQIGKLTVAVEKMHTIIDERVPRKTVDNIT